MTPRVPLRPIGDMMVIIGNTMLGGHGQAFMVIEAFTVFLALIGTTLAYMNTGARVTYAMGRDKEVPEHFGILHSENLTPHRTIWTQAVISAFFGAIGALYYFAGGSAPDDKTIATLPHNIWYAAGMSSNAYLSALPNGLALVTLISNFGIFITYGLTNILCMVAYQERHDFHGFLTTVAARMSRGARCLRARLKASPLRVDELSDLRD
jgi:APA family basic amino acid/polyamine antiporter